MLIQKIHAYPALTSLSAPKASRGVRPAQPVDTVHFGQNPTAQLTGDILENTCLSDPTSTEPVHKIVVRLSQPTPFTPGMAMTIQPPGIDPATGQAFKVRYYSIASPASGENNQPDTMAFYIKKTQTPVAGNISGAAAICDTPVGQKFSLGGPHANLNFPTDPAANVLLIATGTGMAPMLSYIPQRATASGQTWVFGGFKTSTEIPGKGILAAAGKSANHHVATALSHEPGQASMEFVQHKLDAILNGPDRDTFLTMLKAPNTYFVLCGLKIMGQGVEASLQKALDAKADAITQSGGSIQEATEWRTLLTTIKQDKRWEESLVK